MKPIKKEQDSNVTDTTEVISNFPEGSKYLKADFHLHTKADKEFKTEISNDEEFAEKYVNELKSITGGRGTYTMSFSHYEVVPSNLTQGIIDKAKLTKKEEAED
jgi:hypothetical protein